MTTNKKPPSPCLTLIDGNKGDYEIRLVRQIINGTLSGHEFVTKVAAKGDLKIINQKSTPEE